MKPRPFPNPPTAAQRHGEARKLAIRVAAQSVLMAAEAQRRETGIMHAERERRAMEAYRQAHPAQCVGRRTRQQAFAWYERQEAVRKATQDAQVYRHREEMIATLPARLGALYRWLAKHPQVTVRDMVRNNVAGITRMAEAKALIDALIGVGLVEPIVDGRPGKGRRAVRYQVARHNGPEDGNP